MPPLRHRTFRDLRSAGRAATLPRTMRDCVRELSFISSRQLTLTRRQKKVTERLQFLAQEASCAKTSDSDTSSAPDLNNNETQKVSKYEETPMITTASAGRLVSNTSMSSLENETGYDSFNELLPGMEPEQSSPLILALKKLLKRRGQKRGIKMWTQNLANLFYIADSDCSGLIEWSEYSQMIEKLDLSQDLKSSLQKKFKSIDEDGSGAINLDEFLLFFLKFPKFKDELLLHAHSNAPYIYENTLTCRQRWRQWIYCMVECPNYNFISKMLFCFDLLLALVPIVILCIEGIRPSYRVEWYKNYYMWSVSIFFAFEYLCGLFTCKHPKVFIRDPGHYLDAVSFVFWIIYNTLGSPGTMDPMGFIVFRTFRLAKIHHIFKLETLKEDLDIYMDTLTLAYTSYGAITWLLLCSIFFFSLLVYVFERGEYDEEDKTWRRGDEDESPFSDIYNCIYFTVVTMTTLGYGDVSPKSYVGKLVAMVTVLIGLCNITFLINIVGDCFEEVFREFVLKRSQQMEKEHSKYINSCVTKVSRQITLKQSRTSLGCIGHKRGTKLKVQIEELKSMDDNRKIDSGSEK